MNVGSFKKSVDFVKSLTMGKVAYTPIAVNPTIDELKKLKEEKGYNIFVPTDGKEPVYFGTQEMKDAAGSSTKLSYFDVTVYLKSLFNEKVTERITYRVYNQYRKSSTGKIAVINDYGSANWLLESDILAKKAPEKLQWYVLDGVKPAYRGEESLIGFIRALRNLNNIGQDDPSDKRSDNASSLSASDLKDLFSGKFAMIKKVILEIPDARVGFVTGVRSVADGDKTVNYQDFYKEKALRPYQIDKDSSDENLVKEISDAQANNRYANTNFGLFDLKARTFNPAETQTITDATGGDPFASSPTDGGLFDSGASFGEEPDDLPF